MDHTTFAARRETLRKKLSNGAALLLGQFDAPRNYSANTYRFRQDSHFLYYVGTNLPGMACLILEDGEAVLFGAPEDPDDLVWHGPHPVLKDHARAAGIEQTRPLSDLAGVLQGQKASGTTIHYLPPYRGEQKIWLSELLGAPIPSVIAGASRELARIVVDQRSVKTDEELVEIEEALGISAEMYAAAMKVIGPGRTEAEVCAAMQAISLKYDRQQSFQPIVSIRGEVLHNESYANTLKEGDLLLIDSGTESKRFYASDITRTFPVSGRYSEKQKGIYQVVLNSQLAAIEAASPERTNRDLHLIAAETIARGLTQLGLMRGDPAEAVRNGAHALFFPHGLGHMIGLDVHDMEDLGDVVGYPEGEKRSSQFGLAFLRLARKLEPGYAVTVEPGVYFVPALIDRWKAEGKNKDFINYDEVEKYRGFGGVRIEDDIVITDTGCRVLGPKIPKTVEEVEGALKL